jgi:hypothetical protein
MANECAGAASIQAGFTAVKFRIFEMILRPGLGMVGEAVARRQPPWARPGLGSNGLDAEFDLLELCFCTACLTTRR